jgi:hypothetical protein
MKTRLFALVAVALAAGGCNDQITPPEQRREREEGKAPIDVQVVAMRSAEADVLRYEVRLEQNALALGAYQGVLHFDANALELMNASAPGDGYRLVNSENAASGVVRFAGFATAGFSAANALTLELKRRSGSLSSAAPTARLEIAGALNGAAIDLAAKASAPPPSGREVR